MSFQTFGESHGVFSSWNPQVKRRGNQSSCNTVTYNNDLLVHSFLPDVHLFSVKNFNHFMVEPRWKFTVKQFKTVWCLLYDPLDLVQQNSVCIPT
jgi:hypothetical protein